MEPPNISAVARRTSSMSAGSDSQDSVTAMDYINTQLALESEARELMPFSFDTCTNPLGPLRQPVFSCKTCQPTTAGPTFPDFVTSCAAAICYSCSISCHGDHELVEIFSKRDVVCDCGTDRMPRGSSCALRKVAGEKARVGNRYCHNYWGRFCACDTDYDPESEKGTMYQCLLGDACGEDWFHDSCIVGEKRVEKEVEKPTPEMVNGEAKKEATETTAQGGATEGGEEAGEEEEEEDERPNGFPEEESFDAFICWLCVEKNPWLKRYAGTPGFLDAVYKRDAPRITEPTPPLATEAPESTPVPTNKRKADDDAESTSAKRAKTPDPSSTLSTTSITPSGAQQPSVNGTKKEPTSSSSPCTYTLLPPSPPSALPFSLFLTPTFRTHLCHCPLHLTLLTPHPVLLEEEDTYEPPLDNSDDDGDNASVHSGNSLFDRGERALGMVDRVKAIEGVMAYNDLKEKVKGFLKPFAERGEAVGVEDVKRYFAELRGDVPGKKEEGGGEKGDGRRAQSGY